MSKSGVTINSQEIENLMKSKEMVDFLDEKAQEIKGRLGDGYSSDTYVGKTRANASIKADSAKARRDNIKNNTLVKALGGFE